MYKVTTCTDYISDNIEENIELLSYTVYVYCILYYYYSEINTNNAYRTHAHYIEIDKTYNAHRP